MPVGLAPREDERAPLEVEQRYLEAQNELSAVRGVIGTLRSKFDYLDEPLARVLRLTDDE